MKEIVKPKTDVVFKIMFTRKDNEKLLKHFISDILDIKYDSITNIIVENTEITPDEIDGKFTRFDLKLTVDEKLINVEVQVNNYGAFAERSLYYWAQRYGTQLKKGQGYDEIRPTISINIVDFKMFETDSFASTYTMADLEHNKILTDTCAIHFFELPKLDKKIDSGDRKKLWMQLINSESEGDLNMLRQSNVESIREATDVIFRLSDEKDVKDMAERREDALRTEKTALNTARKEGIDIGMNLGMEKGMHLGMEKGMKLMIENLRKAGVSEDIIQNAANQN